MTSIWHPWAFFPFGLGALFAWGIWLYRRTVAHRVGPIGGDFHTTVSVVVPVFGEDPALLAECLDTWLAEGPDELILVVDTGDVQCAAMLRSRHLASSVRIISFTHQGKRSALGVGIRAATGDVLILCDSDTAWTPGLVAEVMKPFADPRVGGVGTRQLAAARETSIWRRIASWLIDVRFLDYTPALGSRGCVPVLSGRTAAYRRTLVAPVVEQLEHEVFLGRECVAGDDGRLTWLVLSQGYRIVFQRSAVAVSMFPATFRGFTKQRVRWARNSYRCYLTAACCGWLWRQPLLSQITILQVLLTPVTMSLALGFFIAALLSGAWAYTAALIGWVVVGRAIRGLSHLREHPEDFLLIPLIPIVVMYLALPLKLFAFFTMNRQGWLTRHSGQRGGEGQDQESLDGHAIA
jgi:cellulose synthase/poly-beta-1,6-N-acetylglucosamine synthase-like glycosyltransferase